MIDIGVNLTSSQFKNDREQVLTDAYQAGVETIILTGTSIAQSHTNAELITSYAEHPIHLYATAGIHPHDANSFTEQSIMQLTQLLQTDKVVAVGECGLDFNRNFSTPEEQLSCFEQQLELAVELKLPVFLHQRDAHKDYLNLIKKYRPGLTAGVAHCFTGDQLELESYLEQDLYIGITGWLCDERRGQTLQNCVATIPLDRVLVETDAPYLFPRDLKLEDKSIGKQAKKNSRRRNEPQYLPHIISSLAFFMDKDEHELVQCTTNNAKVLFSLL